MMKSLIVIFISLIMSLTSCCRDPATDAQLAFTKRYAMNMYEFNNWRLFGYGSGYHEGFDDLSFDFITNDRLSIEEARRLIVKNVEYLSQLIDSDSKLIQFLTEAPFNKNKISLGIMFLDKKTKDYPPSPYLADVIYIQGKIGYAVFNEKTGVLDIIHRETYEEALQIVNSGG